MLARALLKAKHSPTMSTLNQPNESAPVLSARIFWILFALIALAGTAARMWECASWRKTGFDELLYRRYVNLMDGGTQQVGVFQRDQSLQAWEFKVSGSGAGAMPSLTSLFLRTQAKPGTECELPPTRFLYIYTSWLWKTARYGDAPPLPMAELGKEWRMKPDDWGSQERSRDADHRDPSLASLHQVAFFFSILLMIAGGLCAWRMLGRGAGLGVLALMASDPIQLHLSQHAIVDGFFTFWAMMCLWTTWECLRAPANRGWLAAHTLCLALMVMTKENSFFVYCALAIVVFANRWLKYGTVTPRFLTFSVIGPATGVLVLVVLAGGFEPFIGVYQTLVAKAQNLPYAQQTGDGPWYRYLLDIMTVSPIVLVLALGALFALVPQRRELAFLALFVAGSYLIMCNVKYGMNLRYASIWELPLRTAAFAMVWHLCSRLGHRQWLGATVLIAALCVYEFRQYSIFATNPSHALYELVPSDLLKLVNVIKG